LALDAITDFLSMGGYGVYVWPAFAVTAVLLVAMLVSSLRGLRAREAELEALQRGRTGSGKDHEA